MFTSAANASYLDISDDENSNGGGDRSDDDAENITNQRENDEEELDPSIWQRIRHTCLDIFGVMIFLKTTISAPLDCEMVLMMLLPMLWSIYFLERSIYGAVATTKQRVEAV